jgi:hypothetical protein
MMKDLDLSGLYLMQHPFIDSSESFTIRSPTIIEPYPEMFPTLSLSNTTSSQIVPFISGNNSLELTLFI